MFDRTGILELNGTFRRHLIFYNFPVDIALHTRISINSFDSYRCMCGGTPKNLVRLDISGEAGCICLKLVSHDLQEITFHELTSYVILLKIISKSFHSHLIGGPT